jgi:nitrile hydratase
MGTKSLLSFLGGFENLGAVNVETRVFVEPWEMGIFGTHTVTMAASTHLSDAHHQSGAVQ